MKKLYENLSIDQLNSFLIDCIGQKYTNEYEQKNKILLKINSNSRDYENSHELLFSENGILKSFFKEFDENNENRMKKIEDVITKHFFSFFYDASLYSLMNNIPDDNDMTELYFFGVYESLVMISKEFKFNIFEDTYKKIFKEARIPYENYRTWKEQGNSKTLKSLLSMYNQIDLIELKERLILHSFILNLKYSLTKYFGMNEVDWKKLINHKLTINQTKYNDSTKNTIDEFKLIIKKVNDLVDQIILKNNSQKQFIELEKDLDYFCDKHKHLRTFFANWIKGHLLVLKCENEFENKKEIINYYDQAFQNINLAGPYSETFIETSLAVLIHLNKIHQADIAKVNAKDIKNEKGIKSYFTPLANKIYNYSILLGYNDKDTSEASLLLYDDTFNKYFPKSNVHKYKCVNIDEIEAKINEMKNAKENTITKLIKLTEISYPPIVGLIFFGKIDAAIILLEKYWYLEGKNGCKVIEQPATNNSTPLIELLTKFRYMDKAKRNRYKEIILKLINAYSYRALTLQTNRNHMRQPIQEAIHTLDLDIIKAIITKTKVDIDSYVIGLDDESILEYILNFQALCPRLNNNLPSTGEKTRNLEKISFKGTTKKARIQAGLDILKFIDEHFSKNQKDELRNNTTLGTSTRKDYIIVISYILSISNPSNHKEVKELFYKDFITIENSIKNN